MSIGTAIITSALQKIGVHNVNTPASPESIILTMENLNSMLELWRSRNIQFGFVPLKAPGNDLGEPRDVRNGIISQLALYVAPDFDNGGNIVSPALQNRAELDFIEIKRLYQRLTVPNREISSVTPRGQGNQRGILSRNFTGPGFILDS